ncbi:Pyridoxal phosphate phosphatase YbhA|nr:Pyridoxal phosphate phosphatase YbhA [Candidatus Pantoea persica]
MNIEQHGNSKGRWLAEWVTSQGISMLEAVVLGVAMGNADEAIKARAKQVIGTNLEPGIAEVIRKQLL